MRRPLCQRRRCGRLIAHAGARSHYCKALDGSRWRYTILLHRVAISNSRLVEFTGDEVAFRARRTTGTSRSTRCRRRVHTALPVARAARWVPAHPALRLLANRNREAKLQRCRKLLQVCTPEPAQLEEPGDYRDRYQRLTGVSRSMLTTRRRSPTACHAARRRAQTRHAADSIPITCHRPSGGSVQRDLLPTGRGQCLHARRSFR